MAKNNSSNQNYTDDATGFTISGGALPASFSVVGGNPSVSGNTSGISYGFPNSLTYNNLTGRDINGNAQINNIATDYFTTATSGGTTTLSASSPRRQFFTGTSSHVVVLPNASGTLIAGHSFYFRNDSTGTVSIRYADGVTLLIGVPPKSEMVVTCTSVATTNGIWSYEIKGIEGIVPSTYFVGLTANRAIATATANSQPIFIGASAGGLTVGALQVYSNVFYTFECVLYLSGMNGTSGNTRFNLLPTVGGNTAPVSATATFTAVNYNISGLDSTTPATAAAIGGSGHIVANTTGNIVTAATGTALTVFIKGSFLVNASGTIIPSIQLTTSNTVTIAGGSYFKCDKITTNIVPYVGGTSSWT